MGRKVNLVTGATGCLGRDFVREILTKTPDHLVLLVRRKGRFSHWDRIRKMLQELGLEVNLGTRIQVIEGDVSLPGLGIKAEELEELKKKVTHFYHIAALTALNGSEEDCRAINVNGTREALQTAWALFRKGVLKRFYYFSTAYAAGSLKSYHSPESRLPEKPAHANFYESSKYTSETMVREEMKMGLPVTIFRPSIVVGDSQTGQVSEFNVIYPFMKLYAHGILKKLPTRLENSFNIVPIDFVIKASRYIAEREDSVGKCYHLVTEELPKIGMLLEMAAAEYPNSPPIEIIDPERFDPSALDPTEQYVYAMLQPYLGYLNGNLTFDTLNTRSALAGSDIEFPKTDYEFLRVLCQFAVDSGYLMIG